MDRFLKPFPLLVLALATLLGYAPLISAMSAGLIAHGLGCRLDEGNAHPCFVLGHDLGDTLYGMGVLGWLMLGTWPLMLATPVLWCVVAVAGVVRFARRRRRPA